MLFLTWLTSDNSQDVQFLIHRIGIVTRCIYIFLLFYCNTASQCEHVTALTDPVISIPHSGGLSSCEGLALGFLEL